MPVYVYHFSYNGWHSLAYFHAGGVKNFGVAHGDDLILLFEMSLNLGFNYNDQLASDRLIEIYTTFAKSGDPGLVRCEEMKPMCNYSHLHRN